MIRGNTGWRCAGLLAGAFVVASCSSRKPKVVPTPSGWGSFSAAFVAEGPADTAMQGRFEGTATVHGDWIEVVLDKSEVTLPPGPNEKWRNLTVRAFIATDYTTGSWKARVESRPTNVFRFLEFVTAIPRPSGVRTVRIGETLRFLVPIPPGAQLETSRLAIETEWTFAFGGYGETESRHAFAKLAKPPA